MNEEKPKSKSEAKRHSIMRGHKMMAMKDWEIHWNDYHLKIKKGDDLSKVPEKFLPGLRTEKVI